jgi:HNH endonuclease
MEWYNGGMKYIHANCDFCGKPVTRNAALCKSANVKRHFCSMECKAAFQKLAKPVTKEWLYEQYIVLGKDCPTIAREVNRDPKSVWNWLKDFEIPRRPRGGFTLPHAFKKGDKNLFEGMKHTEETKKKLSDHAKATGRVPYDPSVGSYMKGRKGADTPNWKGGITAERQAFYSTQEWIDVSRFIRCRDNFTCQKCGKKQENNEQFDIHHIVSFMCVELRAVAENLIYLCEPCHYWVHSNDNINKEFIKEIS